jgi:transcription initiation factor IIE alpha subunit
MADSKVYVIAPREVNGKLYGSVPLPLENTRELKIWYDSSAPYLYKFEFSAGNRWLEYGASEYHYERGLQRWVYEVDIDGQTVKIEVAMASAAPTSTYMYPLDDLLGCPCPSAYLTDGMLFVVRLHADECAKSTAPSAQLPARSATPTSDEDFLPQYDDELLRLAGLTRQFLSRLLEIVQRRGVVKSAELAKTLRLPKQSLRLGMALSILVQERLIYQKSGDSYSIRPVDYQPASEDMMWRVVKYVCDNPGADTNELAKATGIHISQMSKIARHLAAQGLIRRQLVAKHRGIAKCATWLHYPAD